MLIFMLKDIRFWGVLLSIFLVGLHNCEINLYFFNIPGTYQWTARPSRRGCVWHHFYWDLIAILVPYYKKTTKRRLKNPGKYRADTILVFSTTTYKHALPINLQLRKKNQSMCHLHTKKTRIFFGESTKKKRN